MSPGGSRVRWQVSELIGQPSKLKSTAMYRLRHFLGMAIHDYPAPAAVVVAND